MKLTPFCSFLLSSKSITTIPIVYLAAKVSLLMNCAAPFTSTIHFGWLLLILYRSTVFLRPGCTSVRCGCHKYPHHFRIPHIKRERLLRERKKIFTPWTQRANTRGKKRIYVNINSVLDTVLGSWRPGSINVMMSSLKLDSRLMMSSITSSIWGTQKIENWSVFWFKV